MIRPSREKDLEDLNVPSSGALEENVDLESKGMMN